MLSDLPSLTFEPMSFTFSDIISQSQMFLSNCKALTLILKTHSLMATYGRMGMSRPDTTVIGLKNRFKTR